MGYEESGRINWDELSRMQEVRIWLTVIAVLWIWIAAEIKWIVNETRTNRINFERHCFILLWIGIWFLGERLVVIWSKVFIFIRHSLFLWKAVRKRDNSIKIIAIIRQRQNWESVERSERRLKDRKV
jgi:hypothetical protein